MRILLLLMSSVILTGQPKSPEDIFGFKVGADYKLADYSDAHFSPPACRKFRSRLVGRNRQIF